MKLILTPLEKAIASLDQVLKEKVAQPKNPFLLDAAIQRFEYTYELACKMLKRYLEMYGTSGGSVDKMSLPELIRTGYEQGLLNASWDRWITFRNARNITSHTYDLKKANHVFDVIPSFYEDALFLLNQLQQHVAAVQN
ncbi:MAG: nucleotidyltransferase [Gammaproteobacteria bacterium]|nr:nucleotidyltransferase [Gammaproteobacteria bacterium]